MMRLGSLLLVSAIVAGCATMPAQTIAPGEEGEVFVAAGAEAGWYSHAGAEKLYRQARYKEAEAMCLQAVATLEKSRGKNAWEIAEPLNDLATVYLRQARFAEAKVVLDRAESQLNPDVPEQGIILARLGINKGWRLYTLGESSAAEKVFDDSRKLLEKYEKGETKDLAELINNIALMYEESAREDDDAARMGQARRLLLQAWQMRRKITGEESYESAESLNNLGMFLLYNADNGEEILLAIRTLEKALEITRKAYSDESPETAMSRTNLASAYLLTGKLDEAEREVRQAMPITRRFLGDRHPDRAYELGVLGKLLQEQTHFDEAEKLYIEAVAINEAAYGKNHPNVASALHYLSSLYEDRGDDIKRREIDKRIELLTGQGI